MKNTCQKCQSYNIESTEITLLSMPPQYQFKCLDCEAIFVIKESDYFYNKKSDKGKDI